LTFYGHNFHNEVEYLEGEVVLTIYEETYILDRLVSMVLLTLSYCGGGDLEEKKRYQRITDYWFFFL